MHKLHYPHQLSELISPNCTIEDCEGSIYTVKRTADGKEKRTPCKIIPYVDPERIVACILLQPGKFEQLNEWRGPDDTPGQRPPTHLKGYEAFEGRLDEPIQDIYDAWGWRAMQAGLERRRTGGGVSRTLTFTNSTNSLSLFLVVFAGRSMLIGRCRII